MSGPKERKSKYRPTSGRGAPGCGCGKVQFLTKAFDRQAAVRRAKDSGSFMEAYKCPTNRMVWHIGHPKAGYSRANETRENARIGLAAKQARAKAS